MSETTATAKTRKPKAPKLATGEIAKTIAVQLDMSVKDVKAVLNAYETVALNTLKQKIAVEVPGGTLRSLTRNARQGRNVKTGEILEVPEMQIVRFKGSPTFKKAMRGE